MTDAQLVAMARTVNTMLTVFDALGVVMLVLMFVFAWFICRVRNYTKRLDAYLKQLEERVKELEGDGNRDDNWWRG